MAFPFLDDVDLLLNQLLNARIQNLAADPGTPLAGQVWFNTTTSQFKFFDGTSVQVVGTSSATGTVTDVSVASANGFGGDVATDSTTPVITLKTLVNGLMKGNGTAASAAVAGTDYAAPPPGSGILKADGSGGFTTAGAGSDYLAPAGNGSSLTGLTMAQITGLATALALLAPLANPTFSGTVTVPSPVNATDAASKAYVDAVAVGLDSKLSVAAVATANITLSGTQTVDGVALTAGQRALATGQTTASQNGIWVVASGAWTRPADFPAASTQSGTYVFVEAGSNNANSGWQMVGTTAVTVGTTAQTWTQFTGAADVIAGAGLAKSGNTLEIENGGVLTVAHGGTGGATVAAARAGISAAGLYNSPALGDGSSTTLTVSHNLNNAHPGVTVWDISGTHPVLAGCGVTATDANTLQLSFGATAPATGSIECTVTG